MLFRLSEQSEKDTMPRIPYPDPATFPPKLREFQARIDPNVNVFRMLPWAESAVEHWHRLGNALLQKSRLDPVLREMAIVRVGHLCRAAYEVYQHERISARIGMPAEKIAALKEGPDAPVFDELERLVLRFTDEVVKNVKASDATFDALAARLSHRELCELVLTIGYYQMTCAFLENFEIPIEAPGLVGDPFRKREPAG